MSVSKNSARFQVKTTESLSILNKTRRATPRLSFFDIKNKVLGKNYDLSLVFIGDTRSHTLNKKYRNKDSSANVLSFPLSEKAGEMFIDLTTTEKEASKYDRTYKKFVGFLFIHGLFHLKGFRHSSTMENKEKNIRRQFDL
ncbi:MAG TPA: rRNA maturation RNase YbeY [Candidatus Yonathbacteria bacterium]|nr:rRNA maturation RNase YbeY [Candidatus Yonathbacteria bacterium]